MRLLITGGSGFIGTHLVDVMLGKQIELLNIDIQEPTKQEHQPYWRKCNILDAETLKEIFRAFQPTHVVHLAARTDSDASTLEDYQTNTDGTANVLDAVKVVSSVERFVLTSTQFVSKPGKLPEHDEDYDPHTVYGRSKVITEQLTRKANLACSWTIIRPTNIWGPWHPRYPHEFWRVLGRGLYLHPGRQPVMRCYGYVGNVVFQIGRILEAPPLLVNHKVYYVGDMPINLLDWTNGFSKALTGKDVRIVPRGILRALALVGDGAAMIGVKAPITSSRYRSMTQDYLTPMAPTMEAFGAPPYSLADGINETVQWLETWKGRKN